MRNRARTKQRILEAVERILIRDGPCAVGVNAIANEAGVDKVLIYRYFGSLDAVLKEVVEARGLWPPTDEVIGDVLDAPEPNERSLADRTLAALRGQLRSLRGRPLARRALAWELVERNPLTDELDAARGLQTTKLRHDIFAPLRAPPYVDHEALVTLLGAAITYLAIAGDVEGASTRFGIDLTTDDGWRRIDRILAAIVRTLLSPLEQ